MGGQQMVSRSSSRHFWLFVKIGDLLNLQYKKAKLNLRPASWNSICDSFINTVLRLNQNPGTNMVKELLSVQCLTNPMTNNRLILLSLGEFKCSYFLDSQDKIIYEQIS